tara:strand:+ start:225 stop:1721 length:1497 start_codon:yes stop_codon:yes gene_type:complete
MAQERRKFNLSAALKPAQARQNPYANDVVNQQLARLAYGVGANIAGRDAQRLTNQQTAAQGALASLLMTGSVPGATAASAPTPAPTGFLARAKQFAMPSAPTVAQAGRQFAGATQITPELLAASGADPFQVATAQQTISATNLTRLRDNNLRQATGIASQISQLKADNQTVPQELTDRLDKLKQNLPTTLPAYSTQIIDVGGKSAIVAVDIAGRPVGRPVFAPSPLVSTGDKEREKVEVLGTPAQQATDKAFAKDYAAIVSSGALKDIERNESQIRGVLQDLEDIVYNGAVTPEGRQTTKSNKSLTGFRVGAALDSSVGRAGMSLFNSEALQALETVEEVVQRNLRVILGAQFTQEEGKRLIARAYNPYLSEKQNLVRLRRLADSMKGQLDAKRAAIAHWEKTGSLKDFKALEAGRSSSSRVENESEASDVVDSMMSSIGPTEVPISEWNKDYFDTFKRADGKQTEEWNRLLEDPATRQKLGDRMKELGLLGQSNGAD